MADDRRYTDPELERFFKENREMIQKLLAEEKELVKATFEAERSRLGEIKEERKEKAKETAQEVIGMFTDPEVQRHFVAAGMEIVLGLSAMIKVAPIPDSVRDVMHKAEDAGKSASDAFRRSGQAQDDQEAAGPQKIEIKTVKKQSKAKGVGSSGIKPKSTD